MRVLSERPWSSQPAVCRRLHERTSFRTPVPPSSVATPLRSATCGGCQRNRHRPLRSRVRQLIVAGEPGGSIPEVRQRLEQLWSAQVVDHAGATEIGPWGVGNGDGIHILETEFYPEIQLAPAHLQQDNEPLYELILTNLGRLAAPSFDIRQGI